MEMRPLCDKCKKNLAEKHSVYKGKQYYMAKCAGCRRPNRPQKIHRLISRLGKNYKKCERCKNDFPFALDVHHLDRNRKNNEGWNLKVLCPNCHRLTHFEEDQNKEGGQT